VQGEEGKRRRGRKMKRKGSTSYRKVEGRVGFEGKSSGKRTGANKKGFSRSREKEKRRGGKD